MHPVNKTVGYIDFDDYAGVCGLFSDVRMVKVVRPRNGGIVLCWVSLMQKQHWASCSAASSAKITTFCIYALARSTSLANGGRSEFSNEPSKGPTRSCTAPAFSLLDLVAPIPRFSTIVSQFWVGTCLVLYGITQVVPWHILGFSKATSYFLGMFPHGHRRQCLYKWQRAI